MTGSIPSRIGVIGAGIMGSGIAQVCAQAGLSVCLLDVDQVNATRGLDQIRARLARQVEKGQLEGGQAEEACRRVVATPDYAVLAETDLVIEAASERLELKQKILRQAESQCSPDTILATNTSSLSISALAASLKTPERFIGLHFFNPVPVMALVEVVAGLRTASEVAEHVTTFVDTIGKTPVRVRNSPGFAVNRILCPMINEAVFALQDGVASAQDIDTAMTLGCNQPIGPLALADMIGLDTLLAVMEVLQRDTGDPKYRPALRLREMVDAGQLGRKSGQGFHSYS